jgi:hypothetical protein
MINVASSCRGKCEGVDIVGIAWMGFDAEGPGPPTSQRKRRRQRRQLFHHNAAVVPSLVDPI